jgi:hypothetical protein
MIVQQDPMHEGQKPSNFPSPDVEYSTSVPPVRPVPSLGIGRDGR